MRDLCAAPKLPGVSERDGPLSLHLRWWYYDVTPNEHFTRFHRPVAWLRASRISIGFSMMVMLLLIWDGVLSRVLYGLAARFCVGIYSACTAQVAYRTRWPLLRAVFARCLDICGELEQLPSPRIQARLKRTAHECERVLRVYQMYGWTALFLTFFSSFMPPSWPRAAAGVLMWMFGIEDTDDGLRGRLALGLHMCAIPCQWLASMGLDSAYYTIIPCMVVMPTVMAEMYEALGECIEEEPCSPRWPALQSAVLDASLRMEKAVFVVLPHLLVLVVVMPLFATVDVMLNGTDTDFFAVGMAPQIVLLFVPLCFAGDFLSRAREGVAMAAYSGPWLEEDFSQRRLRLAMMRASCGSAGRLRGIGIGALSREACGNVLKSWFSFVQFFANLQKVGEGDMAAT